jgi:zinc finger-like protein
MTSTAAMVCMKCGVEQALSAKCVACAASMAKYVCSVCDLFDDDPTHDIYHCPFCNLCRRGKGLGVDVFHCMRCNQCMSLTLSETHVCREGSLEDNCPICQESMFTSSSPVRQTPCGHFMHSSCYKDYTKTGYTCPMCSKSLADMTIYFTMLEALVASEELPLEYRDVMQELLCNDCESKGPAPFHFVYHKCSACRSFNTRVM